MCNTLYLASSRPTLTRVWVPVKVGTQNQLVCKWIAAQTTQPLRSNTIDCSAWADDPPALAA